MEVYKKLYFEYKERCKHLNEYVNTQKNNFVKIFPEHWKKYKHFAIFDTNFLINEHFRINLLKNNCGVIIPRIVLSELDGLKNNTSIGDISRKISNYINREIQENEEPFIFIPSNEVTKLILNNYCEIKPNDTNLKTLSISNQIETKSNILEILNIINKK